MTGPGLGPDLDTVLLGGAIAGFTIFLGLPLAYLKGSERIRRFLTALSVGILLFLFMEIAYRVTERVESTLKLMLMGYRPLSEVIGLGTIFVGGFAVALLGLVVFEMRVARSEGGATPPGRLALFIAAGIGLHNFSEGLVIGQQFATGTVALSLLLIVGFGLHNATEGFGIVGPLSGSRIRPWFLGLLGLVGGAPTFVGTYLGTRWTSEPVEVLFLSLAAGAILYVVGELIHLGRGRERHLTTTLGLLIGFFLAFGSDLVIERATTQNLLREAHGVELEMKAGDYFFSPAEVHVTAGQAVSLVVANAGNVEHELEILGLGQEVEATIPWKGKTALLMRPRLPGRYPFFCDLPGHLARGMRGVLVVDPE